MNLMLFYAKIILISNWIKYVEILFQVGKYKSRLSTRRNTKYNETHLKYYVYTSQLLYNAALNTE